MADRPRISIWVEALGARWQMVPDESAVIDLARQSIEAGVTETAKFADLPKNIISTMAALFNNAVRSWEGVLDPEGDGDWVCTPENVAQIPLFDKLAVINEYMVAMMETLGNAPSAVERRTTSTARDEATCQHCPTSGPLH